VLNINIILIKCATTIERWALRRLRTYCNITK